MEYRNVLFCASSADMFQLPDEAVDLVVTSPPYAVGKEYEDGLTFDDLIDLLRKVFGECYRVMAEGGRIAVNVANLGRSPYIPMSHEVGSVLRETGFLMRGEVIWNKGASVGGSTAWGSWMSASNPSLRDVHEYILIFSKGEYGKGRRGESTIGRDEFMSWTKSVWDIQTESANKVGHPAPFPIELPRRLIHLYTYKGDLVLDPFMGSGTTAVAALTTGRDYVGYDTQEKYIDLAEQRVSRARVHQLPLIETGY